MATVAKCCAIGPTLSLTRNFVTRPLNLSQRRINVKYHGSHSNSANGFSTVSISIRRQIIRPHVKRILCTAENVRNIDSPAVEAEEVSRTVLIWRAVKLPLYTVALIPLMVGSATAYLQSGVFYSSKFWSFLFYSILVLAWLNLSNDAFDAETGVDKDKKESVVNMTGSRIGVLIVAYTFLFVGIGGILKGAMSVGDIRIGTLLLAAIACGYVYQCPPFRLSYRGLGEPLCFISFGPLATSAFYLYQASSPGVVQHLTPAVLASSVLVGITTTLILFCSHFHQIEGDEAVGKMSPLVRLGTANGAKVVKWAVVSLYALTLGFGLLNFIPFTCVVGALLTVPIGKLVVSFVNSNHEDKQKIFMAKYYCVRLHTLFGIVLATSLALGRPQNGFFSLPW